MVKKKSNKNTNGSLQKSNDQEDLNNEIISEFMLKTSNLSYEDSLNELDLILTKLQDESIQVEELQIFHKKGRILLEHCEGLLDKVEQEIIDLDKIKEKKKF